MITEKDIIEAYTRIRTIDNTIPDEVLDFIKNASIKQLRIGVVVLQSEQLPDANKHECNCSNAKDRLDCGFECYNK